MPSKEDGISTCPLCGAEVRLVRWTEQHKVGTGLGPRTVAQDEHIEVVGGDCDCEWTDSQWKTLLDNAHNPARDQ